MRRFTACGGRIWSWWLLFWPCVMQWTVAQCTVDKRLCWEMIWCNVDALCSLFCPASRHILGMICCCYQCWIFFCLMFLYSKDFHLIWIAVVFISYSVHLTASARMRNKTGSCNLVRAYYVEVTVDTSLWQVGTAYKPTQVIKILGTGCVSCLWLCPCQHENMPGLTSKHIALGLFCAWSGDLLT